MIRAVLSEFAILYSNQSHQHDLRILNRLDNLMDRYITHSAIVIDSIVVQMRMRVYMLTLATENEAIARAYGKHQHLNIDRAQIMKHMQDNSQLKAPVTRMAILSFSRVKRKMIDICHRSITIEQKDLKQLTTDLLKCLPRKRTVGSRKAMASPKITEAYKTKPRASISSTDMTPEEWSGIVRDYEEEYFPVSRDPKNVFDSYISKTGEDKDIYAWEIEQGVTQDFVYQVRLGQVDAANKNGITDFVWIAIVDNKTDDCCMWRDGMLVSEIEKELSRHDDECDSVVPPAHFNCRCRLAPASDDMPEKSTEDVLGDFESWLIEEAKNR